MTSGEIAALATVIGSFLSLLGITGVDAGTISAAINGLIAIVTFVAAIWAYYAHKAAVRGNPTTVQQ